MNYSSEESVKRACAFIITIARPLMTLQDILQFLADRHIKVNTINLHIVQDEEGILIIHCLIEKDRVRHTVSLLGKIKGIIELELLESRLTNLIKEY